VARHGGVPAPRACQGHRRQQLHHQAPEQAPGRDHRPASGEPGGDEPGVAAADAARLLRRQGHPHRGLLAAGRAELGRPAKRRHGVAGARRDRQDQGEDSHSGTYFIIVLSTLMHLY
jgi:hypothetical protein